MGVQAEFLQFCTVDAKKRGLTVDVTSIIAKNHDFKLILYSYIVLIVYKMLYTDQGLTHS
jgi:hypothetical protein